jgi:endonuclease/exonuclease/phosphatase family metal-dependent hydrolase
MLGHDPVQTEDTSLNGPVLRVVTYNLHSGLGYERALRRPRAEVERNLRGIAAAIARAGVEPVDVVGLNEVDFDARRSGRIDQAAFLAGELERLTGTRYRVVYGETRRRDVPGFELRFGNAALVRHPVLHDNACLYDNASKCTVTGETAGFPVLHAGGFAHHLAHEGRGVITLTVDFDGRPVDVLVTHLEAFALADREAQAAHLVRHFVQPDRTTVLLGDINAVPTALTYSRAFFAADRTHDILTSGRLADARVLRASVEREADWSVWATYPARRPVWPLDAVLGSLDLAPIHVAAIGGSESDHRGFYVEYRIDDSPGALEAQRTRHDAIRRRQLAQILSCDIEGAGEERRGKLRWLAEGTGFLDIATTVEREFLTRKSGERSKPPASG